MKRTLDTIQYEEASDELLAEGLSFFAPSETSENSVKPPRSPRFFHLQPTPSLDEARTTSTTSFESTTTQASCDSSVTTTSLTTTEERKIRNKESVRLYQKKKKQKMTDLETENNILKQEIEHLKQENFILRDDNAQLAQTVSRISAGHSR